MSLVEVENRDKATRDIGGGMGMMDGVGPGTRPQNAMICVVARWAHFTTEIPMRGKIRVRIRVSVRVRARVRARLRASVRVRVS